MTATKSLQKAAVTCVQWVNSMNWIHWVDWNKLRFKQHSPCFLPFLYDFSNDEIFVFADKCSLALHKRNKSLRWTSSMQRPNDMHSPNWMIQPCSATSTLQLVLSTPKKYARCWLPHSDNSRFTTQPPQYDVHNPWWHISLQKRLMAMPSIAENCSAALCSQ